MSLSPELTTICLIALGVGFLILIAGFLMIRVMRGSIFGLGMILMRVLNEGKQEAASDDGIIRAAPHATTDLRARVKSLDFDAAVAKYEQKEEAPPPNNTTSPDTDFPPPNPPPDQNSGGGPR